MPRVNIETLKSKFETGDRPTGEDYTDLIDTLIQQSTDLGTSGNNEQTISGIESATVVDSFNASDWRVVKYIISVSNNLSGQNRFFTTELSILVDGLNVSVSEYGMIDNSGDIGTISVSRNGGNIEIIATPNPATRPVTVRFARIGLKA
jgi:hypothetical protein